MIDEPVFATGTVTIGRFRCPTSHPRFTDSGPIREFCVVFPRTSVWICHRDGRPFVADPTIATLYNKGQEYTRRRLAGDGDRCEWFALGGEVLRDIIAGVDPRAADSDQRLFRVSRAPCDRRIYAAQRSVFRHVTAAADPDRLYVEETVLTLVGQVVDEAYRREATADSSRRPAHREVVEAVRSLLAARVAQAMTLQEISAAVGVSMYHLARLFARVTGTTIHRYRQELRVRAALERVLDTRRDLLAIALELGYSSHSHLTAEFKRAFGVPPSVLRRSASVF